MYLSEEPDSILSDYVDAYLDIEVKAEAVTRNIIGFERFLSRLALCSDETVVLLNLANDIQVSAPTVRQYMEVLEDTLIGFKLEPWQGSKRKSIQSAKFYFSDIGLRWFLSDVKVLARVSDLYGKAFEQFIIQEVRAYNSYKRLRKKLYFWRTVHKDEVDLIIGDEFAIEIKASEAVSVRDAKNLLKLREENFKGELFIVSHDKIASFKNDVKYVYWETFLEELMN